MSISEARPVSLERQLDALIARDISGIAAIDTAIAHESAPDYIVMFQGAKNGKQANVEQMATLLRMKDATPDERGGIRKALTKTHAAIASRLSTTMTLKAMRLAEIELVMLYSGAVNESSGLTRRACGQRSDAPWSMRTCSQLTSRSAPAVTEMRDCYRRPSKNISPAQRRVRACDAISIDPALRRVGAQGIRTRTQTSAPHATTRCSPNFTRISPAKWIAGLARCVRHRCCSTASDACRS
jgi:hypothetical protein